MRRRSQERAHRKAHRPLHRSGGKASARLPPSTASLSASLDSSLPIRIARAQRESRVAREAQSAGIGAAASQRITHTRCIPRLRAKCRGKLQLLLTFEEEVRRWHRSVRAHGTTRAGEREQRCGIRKSHEALGQPRTTIERRVQRLEQSCRAVAPCVPSFPSGTHRAVATRRLCQELNRSPCARQTAHACGFVQASAREESKRGRKRTLRDDYGTDARVLVRLQQRVQAVGIAACEVGRLPCGRRLAFVPRSRLHRCADAPAKWFARERCQRRGQRTAHAWPAGRDDCDGRRAPCSKGGWQLGPRGGCHARIEGASRLAFCLRQALVARWRAARLWTGQGAPDEALPSSAWGGPLRAGATALLGWRDGGVVWGGGGR